MERRIGHRRAGSRVAALVVVALLASLVSVAAAPTRPAGAFTLADCKEFGWGAEQDSRPLAVPDPVSIAPPANTTWNTPYFTPAPGVLANDIFTTGLPTLNPENAPGDRANLVAILEVPPKYGWVTLNSDGSYTYYADIARIPFEERILAIDNLLVDSFQYRVLDSYSGRCSLNRVDAWVTIAAWDEVVGGAPTAIPDRYPAGPFGMSADEVLRVPAPGVLANDKDFQVSKDTALRATGTGLTAQLLTQPTFLGTSNSAGEITEWGGVDDNAGGFTFTPNPRFHGTAAFTYRACYAIRDTAAQPCSDPVEVRIEVAPTRVARPVTAFLQPYSREVSEQGGGYAEWAQDVSVSSRFRLAEKWFKAEIVSQPKFAESVFLQDVINGQYSGGSYSLDAEEVSVEDFTGDQFTYRYCEVLSSPFAEVLVLGQDCTNEATVTILPPRPPGSVPTLTVQEPSSPSDWAVIDFSERVTGLSPENIQVVRTFPTAANESAIVRCGNRGDPLAIKDLCVPENGYDRAWVRLGQSSNAGPGVNQPWVEGTNYQICVPRRCRVVVEPEVPVVPVVSLLDPRLELSPVRWNFQLAAPDRVPPTLSSAVSSPTLFGEWSNRPVVVGWFWRDTGGAGIDPASCAFLTWSVGEGVQTLSSSCADRAGNVSQAEREVKVDLTKPTARPVLTPDPVNGWSNGDATVTWNWSDGNGSGIGDSCAATSSPTGEGPQTLTATCTDLAGNVQTATFDLKVDSAPPTAFPVLDPAPSNGWNTSDVTVTWDWADGDGSGIDPDTCPASSTSSGEGPQLVTATCTDLAGNVQTVNAAASVDKTKPIASPTLDPPPVNGWNRSDVTVTWNWSDSGGSGLDGCTASQPVTGEGKLLAFTECADVAGNSRRTFEPVSIDRTPPVATPVASATGWTNQDVTITWNWADGGSGLDLSACPPTTTVSTEGVQTVTESCTDVAGNTGTSAEVTVRIDKTRPTLAPAVSPSPLLLGAAASAAPNAADTGGSGLASSSCGPVTTSSFGARTLECVAADLAGNRASATVPYTVGTVPVWLQRPTSVSSGAGSSMNASVALTGADGQPISDAQARSLPACSVTFALGNQAPVCATYVKAGGFGVKLTNRQNLTVGTSVTLTVTARIGSTTIGTATTPVLVRK